MPHIYFLFLNLQLFICLEKKPLKVEKSKLYQMLLIVNHSDIIRVLEKMRKKLALGNKFTLIHVGNFTEAKTHEFLIDIFGEVKKKDSTSILLLVGGDHSRLVEKAAEKNLSKSIKYLGSHNDVPDLLQAGDVFVFHSLYEGLPGVVLEAQASGLPCLISDTITDEVCLLLTTEQVSLSESAEEWAKNILEIRKVIRTDTYDEMSKAGYNIKSLVDNLTKMYETYYKEI